MESLNVRLLRILERVERLYVRTCQKLREPVDRCIECREPATCNYPGLKAAYCESHAAFSMDWAPALEAEKDNQMPKINRQNCHYIGGITQCSKRAVMSVRGSQPDRCSLHALKGYTMHPRQKCTHYGPAVPTRARCERLAVWVGDARVGAMYCEEHKWDSAPEARSVEVCCDCEQLCVAAREVTNRPGLWRCYRCFRGSLDPKYLHWHRRALSSNTMIQGFIGTLAPQWEYEEQNLVWSHGDVVTLRLSDQKMVVIDRCHKSMPFEHEAYIKLAYRNLYHPCVVFLMILYVTKRVPPTLASILQELAGMATWPALSYVRVPHEARRRPTTYREDSIRVRN